MKGAGPDTECRNTKAERLRAHLGAPPHHLQAISPIGSLQRDSTSPIRERDTGDGAVPALRSILAIIPGAARLGGEAGSAHAQGARKLSRRGSRRSPPPSATAPSSSASPRRPITGHVGEARQRRPSYATARHRHGDDELRRCETSTRRAGPSPGEAGSLREMSLRARVIMAREPHHDPDR